MAFRTVRNWIRGTDNSNPQPNVSRHGLATLPADSVSIVNRQDNKLGEGSYAKVYGAFHNGKERALKVFKEDLITTEKAVEEFKRLNSLKHPNIVRVYGLWVDPHKGRNALAIVMEICDSSLKGYIKERFARGISREKKLRILHDIASAMIYLHGRNIIHGDLRTPNVLVKEGDNITAKLTDFGMARVVDPKSKTHTTTTFADEQYLPPEVFSTQEHKDKRKNWAKLTPSVDVFCFGHITIELGCGEFPTPTAKVEIKKGVIVRTYNEIERREKYMMKIKPVERMCMDLIIDQCLAERPSERGSFLDLQMIIQGFQRKYDKRPDKELLEEKQLEYEELRSKMEEDQITVYNESLQELELKEAKNLIIILKDEIKQKDSEHAKELKSKADDWSRLKDEYQEKVFQFGDLSIKHEELKEDHRELNEKVDKLEEVMLIGNSERTNLATQLKDEKQQHVALQSENDRMKVRHNISIQKPFMVEHCKLSKLCKFPYLSICILCAVCRNLYSAPTQGIYNHPGI
jgi:serine/threonine protein kinase